MRSSTKIQLVTLLWLLSSFGAVARPAFEADTVRRQHLVYFRDKAGTPYFVDAPQAFLTARAVQRRARQGIAVLPRDLPVPPTYVAVLNAVAGARVRYTSRWFNAAVVRCDSATLAVVQALPFVRGAQTLNRSRPRPARPAAGPDDVAPVVPGARTAYGLAYPQNQLLGVPAMHAAGFRGEGLQIAVLDPTARLDQPVLEDLEVVVHRLVRCSFAAMKNLTVRNRRRTELQDRHLHDIEGMAQDVEIPSVGPIECRLDRELQAHGGRSFEGRVVRTSHMMKPHIRRRYRQMPVIEKLSQA